MPSRWLANRSSHSVHLRPPGYGGQPPRASRAEVGRPGGNRTPNPRFWRPVLCQLSYWPTAARIACPRKRRGLLLLFVRRVLPAESAVLVHLDSLGRLLLVLRRAVVAAFALAARQLDDVSHIKNPIGSRESGVGSRSRLPVPGSRYSIMSVTEPAPTVRPPSRIAKRAPFSSATGAISSTLTDVLSPGMIISTPSLRLSVPVTSVVRM